MPEAPSSVMSPWHPSAWTSGDWDDDSLPLVTLGVLNFNRSKELRSTLDVLTRVVEYPRFEIIVIDNGSTDGSVEMIRSYFPSVQIHEVGRNEGVAARNYLLPLAQGKYLFTFDDDTCPGTPSTIHRIVRFMESHPDLDVLSTTYYQPVTGINETRGWEQFRIGGNEREGYEGIFIVEGGVCFRLESLKTVGGYDPAWLGQEGMELGIRFYKSGFDVRYCPWFLTLHFIAPTGRPTGRRAYVNSRQTIWMLAKHWPIPLALLLCVIVVPRRMLAMLMHPSNATANARGLADGFAGVGHYAKMKPKLTWRQSLRLSGFYLFLLRWA